MGVQKIVISLCLLTILFQFCTAIQCYHCEFWGADGREEDEACLQNPPPSKFVRECTVAGTTQCQKKYASKDGRTYIERRCAAGSNLHNNCSTIPGLTIPGQNIPSISGELCICGSDKCNEAAGMGKKTFSIGASFVVLALRFRRF